MNGQIAQIAIEFMKRVQLQGTEVEAFSAVMIALQDITKDAEPLEVEGEAE